MHEEHMNPFSPYSKHKRGFCIINCVKCLVGVFVLLPLRLATIAIALLCCYFVARIGLSAPGQRDNRPISGWRKVIAVRGISALTWIAMFICGFYRIRVKGPAAAPAYVAPVYIAAPRSNFLNALLPLLTKVSPVYSERVRDTPILGTIARAMQAVFYKGDCYSAEMVGEISRRAREAGWLPVLLFPEEAYTNGRQLIHFPIQQFRLMKPVQPVTVSYSNSGNGCDVIQSAPISLILRILCSLSHSLTVEYLEVVYPEERTENAREFTCRVREKLADSLQVDTTEHSKEDIQLMRYARDLGLPPLTGAVEFMRLEKEYHNLTLEAAEKELGRFFQIDRGNKGFVTLIDFAYFLKEPSHEVRSIFSFYKLDGNGYLTFKNFLEGNLQHTNWPILSPREETGEKVPRERRNTMLLQRHLSTQGENGFL